MDPKTLRKARRATTLELTTQARAILDLMEPKISASLSLGKLPEDLRATVSALVDLSRSL